MKKINSEKNDRPGFFEKMNKTFDVDCDMLCNGFCTEWKGRNHAEICGVKRILLYTDTEVSFVTSDGIFSVSGARLCCTAYKCNVVIVEGNIKSMYFDDGGCKNAD